MTIPTIIMSVGILIIIVSFFVKDRAQQLEKDVEDLSINIYQETNTLKRRLKIVEEELLVDPSFRVSADDATHTATPKATTIQKKSPMETFQQVAAQVQAQKAVKAYTPPMQPVQASSNEKPIHSILISQVLELNKQGLSIDEISKRSTLSHDQIHSILLTNGGA